VHDFTHNKGTVLKNVLHYVTLWRLISRTLRCQQCNPQTRRNTRWLKDDFLKESCSCIV